MRQKMKFAETRHQFERNHILLAGDLIIWLFQETHFGTGVICRLQKIVQVCSKLHRRGTELLYQPINRDLWLEKRTFNQNCLKQSFLMYLNSKDFKNEADLESPTQILLSFLSLLTDRIFPRLVLVNHCHKGILNLSSVLFSQLRTSVLSSAFQAHREECVWTQMCIHTSPRLPCVRRALQGVPQGFHT